MLSEGLDQWLPTSKCLPSTNTHKPGGLELLYSTVLGQNPFVDHELNSIGHYYFLKHLGERETG